MNKHADPENQHAAARTTSQTETTLPLLRRVGFTLAGIHLFAGSIYLPSYLATYLPIYLTIYVYLPMYLSM